MADVNRRELLTSAAALVVSPALPAPLAPATSVVRAMSRGYRLVKQPDGSWRAEGVIWDCVITGTITV